MEKKRTRHGDRVVPHTGSAVSVEEQIRRDYNKDRRNAHWWNGDNGWWPGFYMSLAQKYKMPIAQIKNIIGLNGITDRPLPAPLTEAQIRERQEKRGDFLVQLHHRDREHDFWWALREKEREDGQK